MNKATQKEGDKFVTRWYYPNHDGAVVFEDGLVTHFERIKEDGVRGFPGSAYE